MTTATLLIVEDDGILAANLMDIVNRLGYGVLGPVATGEEAIALLREHPADLVLMDIELAGEMNGIETAAIISGFVDIPVVFLTGFSHEPLLEQAKVTAPYGYLIKPVPERELAATLAMSLHRHALDRQLRKSQAALAESEAKYRLLFENSPLGIFRTTLDGRALLVNAEMARMVGCDSPEVAIRDFTNLSRQLYVEPGKREEFVNLLRTHGEVRNFEYQGRKKNGDRIWISMNARLSAYDKTEMHDGPVIDGFVIDITERKNAEEALQKSEQWHRRYLLSSPLGIFSVDLQGRFTQINPAASQLSGYEEHELLNMSIADLHFKDDAATGLRHFQTALQRGRFQGEMPFRTKTGERRWWAITAVKLSDDRVLGFCNDITERRRAEEELRMSETRYRELVENANSIILRMDSEGRLSFFNEYAQLFFGYAAENVLGRSVVGTIVPETDSAGRDLKAMIADIGQRPELYASNENENMRRDGTRVWVAWTNKPFYNEAGEVNEILCIGNDITERKQAEEEKRQLQAQLLHAQKLEAIGTLAGGIAHDFNNILAAVIGYADMARENAAEGTMMAKDLNQILKAGHRAKDLVKQILAFSRQTKTEASILYPAVIVKEVVKLLRPSLPSTIAIESVIDQQAGPVLIDPTQLHQILMNLCTNAFHAMEEKGGALSLSLKKVSFDASTLPTAASPGDYIELAVGDNGTGIPEDVRHRIFDPFFTTKGAGKGTGMGLSIIHGLVGASNGFIVVDSTPGQGSVFRVYLPVVEDDNQAEGKDTEPAPRGSEHILFVDDETILAEMAKMMLEQLGYRVTVRSNSLEALTTFQNHPDLFDLVITDQTMPGMTGMDLARRLLRLRPDLPVILCTGYSALISKEEASAHGIREFALKPLTRKDMALLIRKVLNKE